jgi:ATP-dependent RNA helicase RhlE
MTFAELPLCGGIQKAIADAGYTTPTPIQAAAIPHVLAKKDIFGCAQTGTGKTAAFALPILQHLDANRKAAAPTMPRVLVLAPTRELANQIHDSFREYGRHLAFRSAVVYGGVGQYQQVRALSRGVHVLVATPGRLLDLVNQGHINLSRVEVLVLDEADRMLDMGFMPDLKRIIAAVPRERQSLFFSATMPKAVAELANALLRDPINVTVTPVASTVDRIEQQVLFVGTSDKRHKLRELLEDAKLHQVLIFTRTKRRANDVARQLHESGVTADAIHGNKSQNARQRALDRFKSGRLRVLVATDIAARGLDVDGISHVINFDLPNEPENYVHRIGRTGRAGASGVAISLCDPGERGHLRDIERLIGIRLSPEGQSGHGAESGGERRRPSGEYRPSENGGGEKRRFRRRKPSGKGGYGGQGGNGGQGGGYRQRRPAAAAR